MREQEASLQQFAEYLLKEQRVRRRAAPYSVRRVRRFFDCLGGRQGVPHPRVEAESARSYLTHLAGRQSVSASTQNQAFSAILFLCREVLGLNVDDITLTTRAKRGRRLPVVLSMPETAALLGAMQRTLRLMASLIYGGGLRVSECCELRMHGLPWQISGSIVIRSIRLGIESSPSPFDQRSSSRGPNSPRPA